MRRCSVIALSVMLIGFAVPTQATADTYTATSARQRAVDYVIARGLAQRGTPFSWAGGNIFGPSRGHGRGEATIGFDSSGLIQYIYAGVGAKLPRSSAEQYTVGQKVTPDQALAGDLIFYGPQGADNVTMYLGNGTMLEAGETGVTVSAVRYDNMAPYLVRIIA